MQTRSGLVHLLDGSIVKLHYRPRGYSYGHYERYSRHSDADAELAKTTKRVLIARVLEKGKKPSPWFEVKDEETDTISALVDWWSSGKAISSIMLR